MRQKRPPIRLIALLVTLLFMCLPKIVQAGPLSSPLISSYNPPFAQANTWDKLQTFSAGLLLGSDDTLAWGNAVGGGTADTILLRDAANTLAQRNGTNAQAFNVYSTFTDASNYARLDISTGASVTDIFTSGAGTGGGGTALRIGTTGDTSVQFFQNNAAKWRINSGTPHFVAVTDNSYDIGASGATRPRTGYFGTSVFSPSLIGGTGTTSTLTLQSTSGVGASGADIIFKVGNNGATEAARILNNGRIGINTPTPGGLLHIYHPTADAFSVVSGDGNGKSIGHSISGKTSGGTTSGWYFGVGFGDTTDAGFEVYNDTGTSSNALYIGRTTNYIGLGNNTTPASLLDLRAGDLTFSGANGQKYVQGRATQLVAVGSGISTKATTIQIPADAIVYAVPVYVKTKPGGTATMTVTATTSGTAFQKGANISTNAGTSDPGTKNTPINYNAVAAQTVTFTFDVPTTDALGEIRVDIYYATSTPPTS